MPNLKFPRPRRALLLAAPLPLAFMLSACPPTQPQGPVKFDKTARLVFPRTTQTITVDGQTTEPAWADGFDYELEQGSLKPDGTLRGVSTESDVYLATKFNGDHGYDLFDAAVFLINPTAADTNYHRIIVKPCGPTGAGCPGNAPGTNLTPTVSYQTGALNGGGTVDWNAPVPLPAGIDIKSSNVPGGTNNSWAIEMKIPRSALGGFNDNWMGLLVNGVVADEQAETAVLYAWPENSYVTGELDIASGTGGYPPIAKWGNATLSTGFGNGVSVAYYEFGSNQANPSQIALNQPNSFHAWAINNTSAGGQLVPAADVTATFQIANFGLGNDWPNVPVAGNPTAAATIPAAGAHLFETGLWNLSQQEQQNYQNNLHQCIRVTLTSTNPNTVIVQPSFQKNMDFVTINSPFESFANLSTAGFEKFMARDKPFFRLNEEFLNLEPGMKWETRLGGAERVSETGWMAKVGGRENRLGVWVNPDDRLALPSSRVAIKPGTGGRGTEPVQVKVEPGSLVTLIVDGALKLGDIAVPGGGIGMVQAREAKIEPRELPQGRPDRIGAVIGSVDGWKTSFLVGNGTTMRMPAGASVLSLMINDSEKGYASQGGDGFSVQVIPGKANPWMLTQFPLLGSEARDRPVFLPLGATLPAWLVHGFYTTNDYISIGGKRLRIERPAGAFGYWIRDVGVHRRPPLVDGTIMRDPVLRDPGLTRGGVIQ